MIVFSGTPDTGRIRATPPVQEAGAPHSQWQVIGSTAVPVSAESGPALIEAGGWRSGYAKTVEGSLFAAIGYVVLSGEPAFVDRLHELVTGPMRRELEAAPRPLGPAESGLALAGFRMLAYTDDTAIADIAWRTADGGLLGTPIALAWIDQDWKVVTTYDGLPLGAVPLASLDGYTRWSAPRSSLAFGG